MREQMLAFELNDLAMPRIGCGLDRLKWERVRRIVEDVFRGAGVNILVCVWK
jgi:hypothetical protein